MTDEKKRSILIRAADFKHPTREELREAEKYIPEFSNFNLKYKNEIISIFDGTTIDEASAKENMYWWNIILSNRFGSLRRAFIELFTHYQRGFEEDYRDCKNDQIASRILFDEYVESFYYVYFASVEVLMNIINEYYSIEERDSIRIGFKNSYISKFPDGKIKTAIRKFQGKVKNALIIRRSFVHRFPKTHPDHRSKVTENNGRKSLNGGTGEYILPSEIMGDISHTLNAMSELMKELKPEIDNIS